MAGRERTKGDRRERAKYRTIGREEATAPPQKKSRTNFKSTTQENLSEEMLQMYESTDRK